MLVTSKRLPSIIKYDDHDFGSRAERLQFLGGATTQTGVAVTCRSSPHDYVAKHMTETFPSGAVYHLSSSSVRTYIITFLSLPPDEPNHPMHGSA